MAVNLGEINFGLGPDVTRLTKARDEILRFGRAVNASARDQSEGARQTEAAMRRQEKAILDTLQKVLNLNDAIRKSNANPANFNATTRALQRLINEFRDGRVSALQFQRSMEDVQASLGNVGRAVKRQESANKALAQSEREAARAAQEHMNWIVKQEGALFRAQEAVRRFHNEMGQRVNVPASLGANANAAYGSFANLLRSGPLNAVEMQRASQQFQSSMARNTETLRTFARASQDANGKGNTFSQMLQRLGNVAVLVNGPLGGVSARIGVLASAAKSSGVAMAGAVLGVGAAAAAFGKLAIEAVNAYKVFERSEKALASLNEVVSYTAVQMAYLMDVSDRSGANFGELSRQFAKLTAAAAGTNLEGERTREIFELVTLAGAKMSLTQEEIGGTIRALEQIISKGSLQMEELRGQLGDRIPGAVQIMARALGLTTEELGKLTKQGKITSDALVPFAQELARTYGVELGDSINTLTASEGRLANATLRFNKAMDQSIGISSAYRRVVDGLASTIDFLAENSDKLVQVIVALGAGFAGLFAPTILAGLWSLVGVIKAATVAMLAFNGATVANPLGALATAVVRVTLAVGGAALAWDMFNNSLDVPALGQAAQAIRDSGDALSEAEFASASYRNELYNQILMQREAAQAAWDEALAQNAVARSKYAAEKAARDQSPLARIFPGATEWLNQNSSGLAQSEAELNALDEQLRALDTQLEHITAMRERLGDPKNTPIDPLGGGAGGESGAARMAKAMREAAQAISILDEQFQVTQLPQGMREWARIQADTNKQIQDFRDKLTDAKVPAGQAAVLIDQYTAAIWRLQEAQYALENTVPVWQMLGDVIGKGIDSAMDSMLDSIIEGKDALASLRDVGKAVAVDLLKTFTQLAVSNPLKNLLFGQQNQTLGFGGGGGLGGILGSLFGGLFGGGSIAGGAPIPTGGFIPGLTGPRLFANGGASSGGILRTPTMFTAGSGIAFGGELDNEAILPLGRTSGGQLGVLAAGAAAGGAQAGDFNVNIYMQAMGDDNIRNLISEGVQEGIDAYDKGTTQRVAQATVKAKFRRFNGVRG